MTPSPKKQETTAEFIQRMAKKSSSKRNGIRPQSAKKRRHVR